MVTELKKKKKLPSFLILFFTNVGPDLANKITVPDDVTVLDYLTSKNTKSMFLSPADENEVLSVVHSCKSKTSIDNDGLNMKFVKKYNTLYS